MSVNLFAFSPYADDKFEKVLQEQRKVLQQVSQLNTKVQNQSEIIEGLTTLNSGLSQKIAALENKKAPKQIDNTQLIKNLASMIDKINTDYVSKRELKNIVAELKTIKKQNIAQKTQPTGFSKTLYKKAKNLYDSKKYSESKKIFKELSGRGYREADTFFYLGEIQYYTGKYQDAIDLYKKSVSISSKGKYMSMLLYHSAYSLEKVKDNEAAIAFYKSIVEGYEGKYVGLAKNRLKKLKIM